MEIRGGELPSDSEIKITGSDPVFSTPFKISETCASVLAGIGVAVSDICEMKTGERQIGSVDVRHAAAALNSTLYMQRANSQGGFDPIVNRNHEAMLAITQPWPTRDGRWFLAHFGLPNMKARVLGVLGCEPTPDSVRNAVAKWDALDLENAIDQARACGAMVRSNSEWLDHSHGQVLQSKPLVEITKIADSDPIPFPKGDRPLSGIRTLDLTRILAGPIQARTLAEHGSDVMMVTAEQLPQIDEHVIDTSHGKRSCFTDLKTTQGTEQLKKLAMSADVFAQGYRPGILEGLGFGPEELASNRPGIVYLSISCFGADGPLSHRAGWEQVAQTVTGICHDGHEDRPGLSPASWEEVVVDLTPIGPPDYRNPRAVTRIANDRPRFVEQVQITVEGSDDVDIELMELLVDGAVADFRDYTGSNDRNVSFVHTALYPVGDHTYQARIFDHAGRETDSLFKSYRVLVDGEPPAISLTVDPPSPARGQTVTLTARARDPSGVQLIMLRDVPRDARCTDICHGYRCSHRRCANTAVGRGQGHGQSRPLQYDHVGRQGDPFFIDHQHLAGSCDPLPGRLLGHGMRNCQPDPDPDLC